MNPAAGSDRDQWLNSLKLLCAQESIAGQARGLANGADAAASILRDAGLQCELVATGGAPIVVGRYDAGVSRTLLLYGRYDVPPPGPRRAWSADPFTPKIRDEALYARGAVVKAELAARAAALHTLIARQLPLNVVMVCEGESLSGSAHLGAAREQIGTPDLSLWSGGGFDAAGSPLLYTGVKGLLRAELRVRSADGLVPATYAATVPNPVWTLVLALASIKSEYEEILIDGFYDHVAPPSRAALDAVRPVDLGGDARRAAWGVEQFLAGVSGAMLTRTETLSPSITISQLNGGSGDLPAIPDRASATLHIQLVPDLTPELVVELLGTHLANRDLRSLTVQQLPGAYPALLSSDLPFDAGAAAQPVFGAAAPVLPLAPFAAPAALLAPEAPVVSCGLERPTSQLFGPDEHVPLQDVDQHIQLLIELITRMAV